MPYNARVFQILIASPSDVQQERDVVAQVIHEWNDLNSRDKGLVLLPLRWETHASPELGASPQTVINRQVVDQCDMVVGVFWTRLGTPTDNAASGTIEEIERAGKAGRIVMLYFSRSKVDLETVDLDEYKTLKEFKKKTYPKGLVESYNSLPEFRDKFTKQLAMKVRDLVAQDSREEFEPDSDTRAPVTLAVACGAPPEILRPGESVEVARVLCTNDGEIPDYRSPSERRGSAVFVAGGNTDYYRQLVRYYIQQKQYRPFRLAVGNSGDAGVHDLYLEVLLRNSERNLTLLERRHLPEKPVAFGYISVTHIVSGPNVGGLRIAKKEDEWEIRMDLPVVQAGRTVVSQDEFYLGAEEDSEVRFEANVYSSHSTPFTLETAFQLVVHQRTMTYQEILRELGEEYVDEGAE